MKRNSISKKYLLILLKSKFFKLKNGKATGLDEIGTGLLKAGSPLISVHLAKIFMMYQSAGKLKEFLHCTKVSPKLIVIILDLSAFYPFL